MGSSPMSAAMVTALRTLAICDGISEAVVVPELGAGLASYDLIAGDGRTPLFRPCRDISRARPFELASNLLLPWSNRISGGGFEFAGTFHPLAPNVAGEPYPLHGNGFSSPWTVESAAEAGASLSLISNGPGPFRYEAHASYELSGGALTMRLSLVNRAQAPLPFGLGFHPWIVRSSDTLLRAAAQRVVLETSDHLPAGEATLASHPEWHFRALRKLPAGWINNGFLGWDGRADIVWRDRKLALEVAADRALGVYLVYSPSGEADFFCFEPVTHPVDAHNAPGGPEANGLAILAPGDFLSAACRFTPRRID